MHSLAAGRQHFARNALRFFAVNEFYLACQNLIYAKVDLFIPRCIDFGLLSVIDLLEGKGRNLALICRERSSLRDVICELRWHTQFLSLRSDFWRERSLPSQPVVTWAVAMAAIAERIVRGVEPVCTGFAGAPCRFCGIALGRDPCCGLLYRHAS